MKWEIILKGKLESYDIEFPLQYLTFEEAESAFLHTVMAEQQYVYLTGRTISTLDVDKHVARLKGLTHTMLRVKACEIKTASYEFRTGSLALRAIKKW